MYGSGNRKIYLQKEELKKVNELVNEEVPWDNYGKQ